MNKIQFVVCNCKNIFERNVQCREILYLLLSYKDIVIVTIKQNI